MGKIKDKIKYEFDNFMTRNPLSQILGLVIVVIIIILIGSAATVIVFRGDNIPDGIKGNFFVKMWWNFMRIIDPGTITGDDGLYVRIISLFSTIGGILIFSILIGILTSKIEEKMEELKKGRTKVIEENHTVILGWSSKIFTIIKELITANENKGKNVIVVMSEKKTTDMYDEMKSKITNLKKAKVIARTGNPIDLIDIEMLNINLAKSIIILSDETEESDIRVIKTILAITNNPNRKKAKYHIVTEITDIQNKAIAEMVGKDELEICFSNDLISRLIVQTSRQSGLSTVYNEILSFKGNEIYFEKDKNIYGKKFNEIFYNYENNIILGYKRNDKIYANPLRNEILQIGDELIVLKDTCCLSKLNNEKINFNDSIIISKKIKEEIKPEKILIIGWNTELVFIIDEIDKYVKKGSKIIVIADFADDSIIKRIKQKCNGIKNTILEFKKENYVNIDIIDKLNPHNYNSIIILTDELKGNNIEEKDANTLITLLFLREILNKKKYLKDINIVSEMVNIKNKELAKVAQINDFIISSKTISMILAQISVQKRINNFYENIFDPDGIEIYLKPMKNYIKIEKETNFYNIMKAAFEIDQIAIGYRIKKYEFDKDKNFGIVINPKKDNIIKFEKDDLVIVFSEE